MREVKNRDNRGNEIAIIGIENHRTRLGVIQCLVFWDLAETENLRVNSDEN